MRFERRPRQTPTTPPTVQRMDAVPLLTAFIKSGIVPAALVETEKAALAHGTTPKARAAAALAWRQARALFYALPPLSRQTLREKFTDDTLPATSAYWIHQITLEADRAGAPLPAVTWDRQTYYRYSASRWRIETNQHAPAAAPSVH